MQIDYTKRTCWWNNEHAGQVHVIICVTVPRKIKYKQTLAKRQEWWITVDMPRTNARQKGLAEESLTVCYFHSSCVQEKKWNLLAYETRISTTRFGTEWHKVFTAALSSPAACAQASIKRILRSSIAPSLQGSHSNLITVASQCSCAGPTNIQVNHSSKRGCRSPALCLDFSWRSHTVWRKTVSAATEKKGREQRGTELAESAVWGNIDISSVGTPTNKHSLERQEDTMKIQWRSKGWSCS